jgi:hypothetical protein
VDLNEVALYEAMGFCFGRKPGKYEPEFQEAGEPIKRHW